MTSRALRALLHGLIDYAGLFPPAGLAMDAAVRNYDSYIRGEDAWMLGRFVVPAGCLAEYEEAVRDAHIDSHLWRLSVLATAADVGRVTRFNADKRDRFGEIDVLEVKAANAREIHDTALAYGMGYQLYFETPPETWRSLLPAMGVAHARAKMRTGGEVATAIPEESRVLEFLRIASERRLAFKATAGLHHPLRAMQRLTYKPDSPTGVMHGFLNVFCAAVLLWHEPDRRQEAAWMLGERDADAITMDEAMTWHNSGITLTAQQIEVAREQFCISFGSCSFTEPIEDLRNLGWL
jgi:hypothetical protein